MKNRKKIAKKSQKFCDCECDAIISKSSNAIFLRCDSQKWAAMRCDCDFDAIRLGPLAYTKSTENNTQSAIFTFYSINNPGVEGGVCLFLHCALCDH